MNISIMVLYKVKENINLAFLNKFGFAMIIFSFIFLNFNKCLAFGIKTNFNNNYLTYVFSTESIDPDDSSFKYDMFSSIEDFVNLPEGGTPWNVFADTGMDEYTFEDEEGFEWTGVRPNFSKDIKLLQDKEILVQGYMFPLDQNEKQETFLLIPFPVHCPYYPHASSNLIIEVHAKKPIIFSYDAIDIKGELELVPKDDLYNIFF